MPRPRELALGLTIQGPRYLKWAVSSSRDSFGRRNVCGMKSRLRTPLLRCIASMFLYSRSLRVISYDLQRTTRGVKTIADVGIIITPQDFLSTISSSSLDVDDDAIADNFWARNYASSALFTFRGILSSLNSWMTNETKKKGEFRGLWLVNIFESTQVTTPRRESISSSLWEFSWARRVCRKF